MTEMEARTAQVVAVSLANDEGWHLVNVGSFELVASVTILGEDPSPGMGVAPGTFQPKTQFEDAFTFLEQIDGDTVRVFGKLKDIIAYRVLAISPVQKEHPPL